MKWLLKFADCNLPGSPAFKARERRNRLIKFCINKISDPKTILDVGGTIEFWKNMHFMGDETCKITIINFESFDTSRYPHMNSMKGDGRDMSIFPDQAFDLVISNSVIEHVGRYDDQKQFADEIQRVGKNFIVQTPNFFFPIEPHFLFPFFQLLPRFLKIFLVENFNLGYYRKTRNPEEIKHIIDSVNLIRQREFAELFPEAGIIREKFLGITQSLIAVGGEDFKKIVPYLQYRAFCH
jgi:ubiquinone/menaquinone biosynthesis C-methylase UbiE